MTSSAYFEVGDTVPVRYNTADIDGVAEDADADPTLTFVTPAGVEVGYEGTIFHPTTGAYYALPVLDTEGMWTLTWESNKGTVILYADVRAS